MLIAANLHNSAALMAQYSLQLLALLAVRPPGSAFLSIYESGSSDATGALARWCAASSLAAVCPFADS